MFSSYRGREEVKYQRRDVHANVGGKLELRRGSSKIPQQISNIVSIMEKKGFPVLEVLETWNLLSIITSMIESRLSMGKMRRFI